MTGSSYLDYRYGGPPALQMGQERPSVASDHALGAVTMAIRPGLPWPGRGGDELHSLPKSRGPKGAVSWRSMTGARPALPCRTLSFAARAVRPCARDVAGRARLPLLPVPPGHP